MFPTSQLPICGLIRGCRELHIRLHSYLSVISSYYVQSYVSDFTVTYLWSLAGMCRVMFPTSQLSICDLMLLCVELCFRIVLDCVQLCLPFHIYMYVICFLNCCLLFDTFPTGTNWIISDRIRVSLEVYSV
jgi:hypothetical protein